MTGPLGRLAEEVAAVSDIYAARYDIQRTDDWYLLKLQEELGELVQAHLKATRRARGPSDPGSCADEAADLFCSLLLYCRRFGLDLDAAVERKWLKYLKESP